MKNYLLLSLLGLSLALSAQTSRTVGVLSHAGEDKVQAGYNLFYPHNQPHVYLLDNCGRIVYTWLEQEGFVPGNTAYITPNGELIKARRRLSSGPNDPIWAGGGGESIIRLDWNNQPIGGVTMNNDSLRLHHDFAPLPNGNVLAIAWEAMDREEAIANGRDPELLPDSVVWSEAIFEFNLVTGEIVWEWHVKDHLVQDYDFNRLNFGDVDQNQQLINFNYVIQGGTADWLHFNSIDYNPRLDQIAISVPHFDELWIIDHSTTTEEAASHSGGLSGMGGDLIYRWGNPRAFQLGTDNNQLLYFQHDVAWIDDFVSEDHPYYGLLSLFNNRLPGQLSSANVIDPAFDTVSWSYPKENGFFLPQAFTLSLQHPTDPASMYSSGLSGVQLLDNENVLITAGRPGYTFELNPTTNEVVWEYRNALIGGNRIVQGTDVDVLNKLYFRMPRYPVDYAGFAGRDLTPGEYLELAPDETLCESISSTNNWLDVAERPVLFPNPTSQVLNLSWAADVQGQLEIVDLLGRTMWSENKDTFTNRQQVQLASFAPGVYVLRLDGKTAGRFVKVD